MPNLIRGWSEAVHWRDEPPALVLAGGSGWDHEVDAAIAEVSPNLRVLRPGYLRFQDLPGYLGGALIVAYPSHGEGFGLPVLEAMACGAPVLTTPRLSLPEVGGDAVAYTQPEAPAIADAPRRSALRRAAPRRSRPRAASLGRTSSPGPPAPRRTWRATPAPSGSEPAAGPLGPGRRRHVLAGPVAADVPVLAAAGDRAPLRGRARRQRFDRRRSGEAAAEPGVTLVRTGGNVGYGRAANAGAAGRDGAVAADRQPRRPLVPAGCARRLLAAGERWPKAGAFGPAIVTPDGAAVPERAGAAVARARASATRWPAGGGRPTRGPRPTARSARSPARAVVRLAVRVGTAGAPRSVRGRRRVRPEVLHVLRRRRPVRPARAAPAGARSTCRRPSSNTPAATRRAGRRRHAARPSRAAPTATSPTVTGACAGCRCGSCCAPVCWRATCSRGSPARTAEGAAPTRSADAARRFAAGRLLTQSPASSLASRFSSISDDRRPGRRGPARSRAAGRAAPGRGVRSRPRSWGALMWSKSASGRSAALLSPPAWAPISSGTLNCSSCCSGVGSARVGFEVDGAVRAQLVASGRSGASPLAERPVIDVTGRVSARSGSAKSVGRPVGDSSS